MLVIVINPSNIWLSINYVSGTVVITDYSNHLWHWFTSSDDNKYDYNNKYVLGIYFMPGTVQSALYFVQNALLVEVITYQL